MTEDRVSRNAGYALLTQLIGAVFTAGLMIFLGRQLTPTEYGYFAFATSITLLASVVADLGISASAARFIAERIDDRPAAARVFYTAMRLKLLIAGAVAIVLILAAKPICDAFGSPGAAWALRGAGIALIGQSMFLLLLGALAALRRQRYSTIIALAESAVEICSSVTLVLLGAGAAGAAFGRAIGFAVGLAVGLVITARVVGRARRSPRSSPPLGKAILRYAGPLLLVDAAFRVFSAIDVLLISAILGGGALVAAYELPMRLIVIVGYPAAAAASAVAPLLARRTSGDRPDMATFEDALRYLILLQMVFVPPLLIWPEAIIDVLFGNRYPDAPAVLRALVPFVLLSGVAQPVTLAVNYVGEARRRVPIAVVMLTVNVVIDVILLPHIGPVAAGIGTSAAYMIWVPAHFWLLRRHAGLPLRPVALTTVRAVIAGAVMTGALVLLGTGNVGVVILLIGAVLGPAVYVLALMGLRELSRGDLMELRGAIARRAQSTSR